jgi:hypothetical protein
MRVLLCLMLLCTSAVAADAPIHPRTRMGTPAQRAACTPDVIRLCGQYIPNVALVIVCMRLRRAELSPACAAATKGYP